MEYTIYFLILIIYQIKCNLVIIPFIIKEIPGESIQKYIYTSFEMGYPEQKIDSIIDFQNSKYFMIYNYSITRNSTFNISLSKTFSKISNDISITESNTSYLASDDFYFYSDINCQNKKKYESLPILFPNGKKTSLSPIIGLQIEKENKSLNFINILKSKNIITNYFWSIKFKNINEGIIVVGDLPHNYDKNNYEEKNLHFINTYSVKNKIYWGIHISSIKFSGLTISDNMPGRIEPKILEIIGSYEYIISIEKLFFQNYIDNNKICRRIWDIIEGEEIFRFICEKDKFNKTDIDEFPPLTLINVEMNYSFIFYGKELFQEKEDKIIFQIVAKNGRTDGEWILGRIFLSKYQVIFDNENNLVGLYKINNENTQNGNKNKNLNLFIILIILIIILLFLIGSFIYIIYTKKLICKSRKKRFPELDDGFEYVPKGEINN